MTGLNPSSPGGSGIKKARSGCLTCKRRRVKCDEAKPDCKRCLTGGRHCEGYDVFTTARLRRQMMPTISGDSPRQTSLGGRLLSPFRATEAEWQAYYFYFQEASVSIGGNIDVSFWHDTVLCYAQTESAIRYAVFAIGSFSRHVEVQPVVDYRSCSCQHCHPGLKYYNKAISSLNDHIQSTKSRQILLLACVLFICIEEIQGNVQNAVPLIRQGCSMLQQHRPGSPAEDEDQRDLMTQLAEIFDRLRFMSGFFGHPMEEFNLPPQSSQVKSIREARYQLYSIMNDANSFIRQAGSIKWIPYAAPIETDQLRRWQANLSDRLGEWYANFFHLSAKEQLNHTHHKDNAKLHDRALMNLRAYYLVAKIWVATGLAYSETAFEEHLELFKSVVDHASLGTQDQSRFTFEMGLALPLYFTATKCRNPSIRRHAVALLSLMPRRQGVWNRAESVTVASRIIELEEEYIPRTLFTDVNIEPLFLEDSQLKVPVTFMWRATDPVEAWASKKESLLIADGASGDVSFGSVSPVEHEDGKHASLANMFDVSGYACIKDENL